MNLLIAAFAAMLLAEDAPKAPPSSKEERINLVANGGFEEKGAAGPRGWGMVGLPGGGQEVDGLTSFWVKEGPEGSSCLKFDTDVNLEEAKERWKHIREGGKDAARPKSPTRPPYYDTVGGNDGVNLLGQELEVKPGMAYEVQADVKTTGTTGFIFIRGYGEVKGEKRVLYKYQRNLDPSLPGFKAGEWFRVKDRNLFHPTQKTPKVKWIRVSLYAYWPVGNMWFDNVAVYERPEVQKVVEEKKDKADEKTPGDRPRPPAGSGSSPK